jgi:preprotein translocase subunit Sec63
MNDDQYSKFIYQSEMAKSFPGDEFDGFKTENWEATTYDALEILDIDHQSYIDMQERAVRLSLVKERYRQLSLLYHPDKSNGLPDTMKGLNAKKFLQIKIAQVSTT